MRALIIAIAVLAVASVASGESFVWFFGAGDGDFMDSPPVFAGVMDPGGTIGEGGWSITVPDAGWPLDPVARAQYVWTTFFADNYTPGTPGFWKGHFDVAHGLPELSALTVVDDTNGGTMYGTCTIEIQVLDLNSNGELDEGEYCSGSLTGLVIIVRQGDGVYDGMCGEGNYFGTYDRDCPNTLETWNFGMYLWLEDCSTPVEDATWGSIKALYQ